jgi:hypothetical protein
MTLFNIGDILTQRYNGTGKPSYKVVDITDTQYIVEQYGSDGILNGNIFTWDFSIIESYHVLYIPPATPAKGQITTMEFPSSVQHGKPFGIFMQDGIRNTGGSVGIFRLNAYINGTLKWTSGNISISPGNATGPTEIPLTAPSTGTTMTFIIKCIRYP